MKYILYLFIFICWSCREEIPWRIEGLCEEIKKRSLSIDQIDSMMRLTEGMTPLENYIFACNAARYSREEDRDYYRQKLRALPFPEVKDKKNGLLLMEQYANGTIYLEDVDMKMFSVLLFNMENRIRFTPEEKCRYLFLKSGVYCHLFREYDVAASIAEEAARMAREIGLTGKILFDIYCMQHRCYAYLGMHEQAIKFGNELLDSAQKYQLDSVTCQTLGLILYCNYCERKEYEKAYSCWEKIGKPDRMLYDIVEMFLGCNRAAEALDFLERHKKAVLLRFKENPSALYSLLALKTWLQAKVYLWQGDTAQYERYLVEAVDLSKLMTHGGLVEDGALLEAYAHLLWKQGRRQEAIRQMEMLSRRLACWGFGSSAKTTKMKPEWIDRMRLLADYYIQTGRSADAYRQLNLCDSLKGVAMDISLREEKRKISNRIYVDELRRSLEARTVDFLQERQRMLFVVVLFNCAALLSGIFGWLYFRRQKELNAIYVLQKQNERLESALEKIEPAGDSGDFPPDKQLYLSLQKQMYEQKLFLKPDFSRDDLCRLAGSNRMYVSTSINKYAEMNLNQWINKARVNHAIGLIRSGETKLQVLSDSSGFSSSSAFYRNFKQFTLLTPTQYIEREKKAASSSKNKEDGDLSDYDLD